MTFFTIPVYVINIPPVGGHLPKARADRHKEHLKVPVRLQSRTPLRRQGLGQRVRVLLAVPERLPGIVGFRGERGHIPETGGEERVSCSVGDRGQFPLIFVQGIIDEHENLIF